MEIKPLSNGSGPMSASVDELRATVENLSLSPIGVPVCKFGYYKIYNFFKLCRNV